MKVSKVVAPSEELLEHLRAQNREKELEIKRLRDALGGRQEMMSLISTSLKAASHPAIHKVKMKAASPTEVAATFVYSDWHTGEVIQASETEGFGEYNYAIQQERVKNMLDAQVTWADKQRNAYNIQDAVLLLLGDWVSGNIHPELETSNEFPVPVQAVRAGMLLGETFRTLGQHFRNVIAYEVQGDNHGRLQRKPQAKQKGWNNWSFVAYEIANAYCAGQKNLKIISHAGMKDMASIAGWSFLMEHGDTIRSNMGIPLYGILRSRWREAVRRMGTNKAFQYYVIGHFHVPGFWEDGIILNGSLSGTSEFDHSCGRHARPSQVAFLCHPKHGVYNFTPFKP